jgi:hypothetical protein
LYFLHSRYLSDCFNEHLDNQHINRNGANFQVR